MSIYKLLFGNASLGKDSSRATCKGVLQLEATFIDENHVSPPGLQPGSLEYRCKSLTITKTQDEETCLQVAPEGVLT